MTVRQIITLIHHPTVALRVHGFSASEFPELADSGAYLGNIYRKIMPPSLPRVASVLEKYLDADVRILDLRIAGSDHEETMKTIGWEGYDIEVTRIGAPFAYARAAIEASDWVGFTSHFTYESGVVKDLIAYAKQVKPSVKVMVGGADVKARPADYLAFGADLVSVGDLDPNDVASHTVPRIAALYRHDFHDLITPAFEKLEHLADYSESHDGPVPAGVPHPIAFPYFTRGCPRECDFCESRRTKFEALDLDASLTMLQHYSKLGVTTINFADDNLLLAAATKDGRARTLELFRTLRSMQFAWEFPNGLEIGRFMQDGRIDEELMFEMFSHERDPRTGRLVGGYRVYIPVETFDHRDSYKKLKPIDDQNRIISLIAASGLPEMNFGVVVPPDATPETFERIREGYTDLRDLVHAAGAVRARYAVFHLIPISLFRDMKTKYSVEDFPEGWNFYFPVYDGAHMSARELFERRLRLLQHIDPANYESMQSGQYSYQ